MWCGVGCSHMADPYRCGCSGCLPTSGAGAGRRVANRTGGSKLAGGLDQGGVSGVRLPSGRKMVSSRPTQVSRCLRTASSMGIQVSRPSPCWSRGAVTSARSRASWIALTIGIGSPAPPGIACRSRYQACRQLNAPSRSDSACPLAHRLQGQRAAQLPRHRPAARGGDAQLGPGDREFIIRARWPGCSPCGR
jgi:hypothetical protein